MRVPSCCCFSLSRYPLGPPQPKRLGSIGMTSQIQDIAKPHLPAFPWVTMSPKTLDFARRTEKEAATNCDKNQSALPNQRANARGGIAGIASYPLGAYALVSNGRLLRQCFAVVRLR